MTKCHSLKMTAADGKQRLTDVADTEQLLRLIQSIPSPKAEPFTKDISRKDQPDGFEENRKVARRGGNVANIARRALEAETGESVITSQNAAQLHQVVADMIEGVTARNPDNEDR